MTVTIRQVRPDEGSAFRAHADYDLELDTSVLSAEQCAARIKEALEAGQFGEAFLRLRERYA